VRAAVDKGTTVHVLAGSFEGKVGVVQELDGKGNARVVLGTMSTWVPIRDLTEERAGGVRPSFKSSHRKPVR
jgi:ribosomal protein L24